MQRIAPSWSAVCSDRSRLTSQFERMACPARSGVRVAICAAGELWGGVEQCLLTLARGLSDLGNAPYALLFYDGPLARALRESGIETSVYPGGSKYDPRLV